LRLQWKTELAPDLLFTIVIQYTRSKRRRYLDQNLRTQANYAKNRPSSMAALIDFIELKHLLPTAANWAHGKLLGRYHNIFFCARIFFPPDYAHPLRHRKPE
jgi:hypothetical protein